MIAKRSEPVCIELRSDRQRCVEPIWEAWGSGNAQQM